MCVCLCAAVAVAVVVMVVVSVSVVVMVAVAVPVRAAKPPRPPQTARPQVGRWIECRGWVGRTAHPRRLPLRCRGCGRGRQTHRARARDRASCGRHRCLRRPAAETASGGAAGSVCVCVVGGRRYCSSAPWAWAWPCSACCRLLYHVTPSAAPKHRIPSPRKFACPNEDGIGRGGGGEGGVGAAAHGGLGCRSRSLFAPVPGVPAGVGGHLSLTRGRVCGDNCASQNRRTDGGLPGGQLWPLLRNLQSIRLRTAHGPPHPLPTILVPLTLLVTTQTTTPECPDPVVPSGHKRAGAGAGFSMTVPQNGSDVAQQDPVAPGSGAGLRAVGSREHRCCEGMAAAHLLRDRAAAVRDNHTELT